MLFISPEKLLLFSRYVLICLDVLVNHINGLIRKIRLISKFMTLRPGKQTIAIHILPNISKSKGNQALKFCQLIEYNMKNIFLENHTLNVVEKLFPDSFLRNQN